MAIDVGKDIRVITRRFSLLPALSRPIRGLCLSSLVGHSGARLGLDLDADAFEVVQRPVALSQHDKCWRAARVGVIAQMANQRIKSPLPIVRHMAPVLSRAGSRSAECTQSLQSAQWSPG